jgi:hypothetical protein
MIMAEHLSIIGLTDLDRLTLDREFKNVGQGDAVSFDEKNAKFGTAGSIDPIIAAVVVSSMTLTVIAIWICVSKRRMTKIKRASDGVEFEIEISESSDCKSSVLAELVKLFPGVTI